MSEILPVKRRRNMSLEASSHKQFILVQKSKAGSDLRNVVTEGKVHRTEIPQDSEVCFRASGGPLLTI